MSSSHQDTTTTAELRNEIFGVHIPELQLSSQDYRAAFQAVNLTSKDRYLELGSGHGIGLSIAAAEFGAQSTGVEYLEDAIARSLKLAQKHNVSDLVSVLHEDLRRVDISHFDVIYMHLGPAFHDVLASSFERLISKTTRVIAAGWSVPGWKACDSSQNWDAGYIYEPANPKMQVSWGKIKKHKDMNYIDLSIHADLTNIEARIDGHSTKSHVETDRTCAARGTTILVAIPAEPSKKITIWAKCRSGNFMQRGTALII